MTDRTSSRRSLPSRRAKRKAEEEPRKRKGMKKVRENSEGIEREEEDKREDESDDENDEGEEEDNLSYKWLDSGKETSPGGQMEYQLLEMVMNGRTTIVSVGDTVMLASDEAGSDEAFVAKVERMWQSPPHKTLPIEYSMKIRARWYFKRVDVQGLKGNFSGAISKQQLLSSMTNRDLILSDQYDDNDVLTVLGKCTVVNRRPSENDENKYPAGLLPEVWVSRYSVTFGDTPGTAVLTPYDGESQPWPEPAQAEKKLVTQKNIIEDAVDKAKTAISDARTGANINSHSASSPVETEIRGKLPLQTIGLKTTTPEEIRNESPNTRQRDPISSEYHVASFANDDDEETIESDGAEVVTEDIVEDAVEGATEDDVEDDAETASSEDEVIATHLKTGDTNIGNGKGKLMIGPDHQVRVKAFQKEQRVISRKPHLIWKKEAGIAVDMEKYLENAAEIILQYLQQNGLLTDEQYFPLPHERMESYLKDRDIRYMTLSNLSTGCSMTTTPGKLTRECKIDNLMELLHIQDYNVDQALKEIHCCPQHYVTAWTRTEREFFQTGFRRYSGSLRMISTNSLVSKSMKDVVDYYYRFKIPDQFRRYQDKKREHAVRMMQIIENRRKEDSVVLPRDDGRRQITTSFDDGKSVTDWSKISMSEIVGAVDDRRASAKDLLLDIQHAIGTEKMTGICKAIKSFDRSSVASLKDHVENLLTDHSTLLKRFLEFLPKRYRA